jgi:hypothetical protein
VSVYSVLPARLAAVVDTFLAKAGVPVGARSVGGVGAWDGFAASEVWLWRALPGWRLEPDRALDPAT